MRVENQRVWSIFLGFILMLSLTSLSACSKSGSGANNTGAEHQKRVAIFRQLYMQMKQQFAKDGVMQLPADSNELFSKIAVHSSIDPTILHHNSDPISLDGIDATPMHVILLHDSADLGDGTSRVILFADGHVEVSIWQSQE